jgi:very-short-patch-repair endonuclease
MTPPERRLWNVLRERSDGFKFRKQCPQGPYSLDFACLGARLVIEVDGEAHNRAGRPERDAKRDAYLEELGLLTMRIPARELAHNLEGVVLGILEECRRRSPPRSGEALR